MRIEIREESVIIDGYVNAVERESKPLAKPGRQRRFVEKIKAGAFGRAIVQKQKTGQSGYC